MPQDIFARTCFTCATKYGRRVSLSSKISLQIIADISLHACCLWNDDSHYYGTGLADAYSLIAHVHCHHAVMMAGAWFYLERSNGRGSEHSG